VVFRGKKSTISASIVFMAPLEIGRLEVMFVAPHILFMRRACVYATAAPVVANVIHSNVMDNGLVIDVNVRDGHIAHAAVVVEMAVSPIPTFIAGAIVAETIVHAAVESDVRSPVASVPHIRAIAPSPVSWGPE
jgi:hypothetical protein